MTKAIVSELVTAVIVFLGFILSKYLPADLVEPVKGLLVAVGLVVTVLISKWLGIEQLKSLGLIR